MGSKGGSAPATPDYSSLIAQQGAINYGDFANQTSAGRVDQTNPYGTTSWQAPPGFYTAGATSPTSSGTGSTGSTSSAGTNISDGLPSTTYGGTGQAPSPFDGVATSTGGQAVHGQPAPTGSSGVTGSPSSPGATGNPQTPAGLLSFGGAVPTPSSEPWTESSSFSQPVANVVNPALSGASGALAQFNPSNNPQFNPAQVGQGIYQGEEALMQPQMQSQMSALQNSLQAEGYDINQSGGAQTAINNLQNQQNLVNTNLAGQAIGEEIPQGAQALQAEQSAQTLPLSEASGLFGLASSAGSLLPAGNAQTASLSPVDSSGITQQGYADQVSAYNADQASAASNLNGLFGLAGTGALAYALALP
jgi:hypothetical protein